jgi:hypothetical protein
MQGSLPASQPLGYANNFIKQYIKIWSLLIIASAAIFVLSEGQINIIRTAQGLFGISRPQTILQVLYLICYDTIFLTTLTLIKVL